MNPPGNPSPTLAPVEVRPAERALDDTLALVERCGATLEERLAALCDLAPRLELKRSLHAGAWIFGVAGERDRDGAAYGRLSFHLNVRAGDERLVCVARGSAGGRDRRSEELDVALSDEPLVALADFAERIVLSFAGAYFASDRATTRSVTP
ncbi:MAG: hypothetical protein DHS20C15_17900 [Planctomycetota bacterium]|nr:MAG: hypothetical protein DHS20C15_17900 [Planctomycetota bacterium]